MTSGFKTINDKVDLIQEWLWRMKVIDKTKGIREFHIKDYSNLLNIIEYKERIASKKAKQECLKIARDLKCHCEICAFEGQSEEYHDKLISIQELKQKLEGEKQ